MRYRSRVKAAVKQAGSQRALATRWGISNQTISNALYGRVYPVILQRLEEDAANEQPTTAEKAPCP